MIEEYEDRTGISWWMMLGFGALLCVVGIFLWQRILVSRVAFTTMKIVNYQTAIRAFNTAAGRWPTSLGELETNSMKTIFVSGGSKDAWGGTLVYVPFDAATGFGRVVSFGRDGKPGGTGPDADIERRFP